jgi:hypothetical protein
MSVKKVVKFAEEKENKMQRTERNTKYTENTKVIEEPQDPEKKFEEGFKEWKRVNKQARIQLKTELRECLLFKPIIEEIMEPSVHYKEGEGEGWESDCDGWFD